MLEYASNTADLGQHRHVGFPVSDSTLHTEWRNQCKNQKISNVGAYQNVTVFWFRFHMSRWSGAHHIFVVSDMVREETAQVGKRIGKAGLTARRIAWNIDGKSQQQRVALRTVGYQELVGGEDDVPFLEEEGPLPLPFSAHEGKVEGRKEADPIYIKTSAINGAVGYGAEDIDLP
jgi:hypothetical protein